MSATVTSVSFLFVPASRPERFAKAAATGALPILDLEDAVAADDKPAARAALLAVPDRVAQSVVRVNAAGTADFDADIEALAKLSPAAVMLAKTEDSGDVARARAGFGDDTPIIPLIETARGLAAVREIAASPGVVRLAFGTVDLCLDLGIHDEADVMASFRAAIVLASRLGGISAPIDGVCTRVADDEAMARHAARAAACGFGGVLCIHPRQVPVAEAAFAPSAEEVDRARRILEAAALADHGAIKVDGQMVDRPVVELAQRTIALHRRFASGAAS